jgi:uncharacterized protein (TIGR03086 family)
MDDATRRRVGAMTEVAERYGRVADGFSARIAGIADDAWIAPTPCRDWTVRDLVGHVISVHRHVAAGMVGDLAAPATDPDLPTAWIVATAEVRTALADPDRAAAPVGGRFAPMSLEDLIGRLLCIDTVVHTWDLAHATGQPDTLDAVAVTAAFEGIRPADEAIRGAGGFGPKLEPPANADEQTRFLCFLGRRAG